MYLIISDVLLCREEQYRQMWAELEVFVRKHCDTSANHGKVLECLLECKKPSEESKPVTTPKKEKAEPANPEQSWRDLERSEVTNLTQCT